MSCAAGGAGRGRGAGDQSVGNGQGQVNGASHAGPEIVAPLKKTREEMEAAVNNLKEQQEAVKPTVARRVEELEQANAVAGVLEQQPVQPPAPSSAAQSVWDLTDDTMTQRGLAGMLERNRLIQERIERYRGMEEQ